MNRKHKHRSHHRAAAFTQAKPIQHPIAMDYRPLAYLRKGDRVYTSFEEFMKDRHPATFEPLDEE